MRITFVSPTVNMGGGTKVISTYARALACMGHVVRVVSPPPASIPFRRKVKSFLAGNGWPGNPRLLESHFDGTGIDHHVLDRSRPVSDDDVPNGDIVVATWWETAEWVYALRPSSGAKVYFIQGHEVFPHLPVSRCHATYRLPMHKIVVSRWLQKIMSTQYADDVVDLVPNSVDRTQFYSEVRGKQEHPAIGFLYTTSPVKGLDTALESIAIVRERIPNLRLICFGIEEPGTALRLPEGAEFIRSPRQHEIKNLYSKCDVWITASRSDGFNLPAIEAMACRTPVVATRTGWPEEAIATGKNGVLVDVDDKYGLARGVEWVLSLEDEAWRRLSSNAFDTATSSTWQESAEKFERALIHACRRSASGEIEGSCGGAL